MPLLEEKGIAYSGLVGKFEGKGTCGRSEHG